MLQMATCTGFKISLVDTTVNAGLCLWIAMELMTGLKYSNTLIGKIAAQNCFSNEHNYVHIHAYIKNRMEEDDSILDTPQDDIIVRETQRDQTDSPRSFVRQHISRLGLSRTAEAETAPSETIN